MGLDVLVRPLFDDASGIEDNDIFGESERVHWNYMSVFRL